MTTYNFSLLTGETGPLAQTPEPDHLRIPVPCHTPILAEGDEVLAGTKIATALHEGHGDMHASMSGTITDVTADSILIEVNGTDRTRAEKLPAEGGPALKEWLRHMGVNVTKLNRASTLIINAVPPEPGITVYDPLLRDHRKALERGVSTVQKIVGQAKTFLVAAKGNRANAFSNCTVVHIQPEYPNGLTPLVFKAVTGQEIRPDQNPDNTVILTTKELYFIGKVAETGRPLTDTVMTIGSQNYLVHVGTPNGFLVAQNGGTPQPGDKIVLGGLLRGIAAVNLEQGVDKETYGLNIVREGQYPKVTDKLCMGCGECERHCPSRLMPGLISRCAEFKLFDRAESYHIHSCMECGVCGYWCKARRPLLQYIQLAKYELSLLKSTAELTAAATAETEEQAEANQ